MYTLLRTGAYVATECVWRTCCRLTRIPLYSYLGWLGHGNVGDEAVYAGLKRLDRSTRWTVVEHRHRTRRLFACLGLDGPGYLAGVCLGGGTLIGSEPFRRTVESVQQSGHKLFAMGTGVGQSGWDDADMPDLGSWAGILHKFGAIGVRGPDSRKCLERLGFTNAREVGDLALALAGDLWAMPQEPLTVAVNVTVPGARDRASSQQILNVMSAICRDLIAHGYRVLPLVTDKSDIDATMSVCRESGSACEQVRWLSDADAIVAALRSCVGLVGVRLHSAVLAVCAGVPPVLLSYRPKCMDFMRSMGLEKWCIEFLHSTMDTIRSSVLGLVMEAKDNCALRGSILDRAWAWKKVQGEFLHEQLSRLGAVE